MAGFANIFFSAGKKDTARKLFKASFKHGTKNPVTYLNYAVMILHEDESEQALEYAQKGIALGPDIMAEKNLKLTLGSAYWKLGQVDKLEAMLNDFDYVNVHVLTTLGYLYFVRGDLDKARTITERAIEDTPDSGPAWDNMGQIYLKEGNLEKAEEAFEKAGLAPASEEMTMLPQNSITIDAEAGRKILRLIEAMEDNDDVQNVHANFDLPEELLAEME